VEGLSRRTVIRDRQRQHCLTTRPVRAVSELQHAAVGFSDLVAQDQSDAAVLVVKNGTKRLSLLSKAGALVADEARHCGACATAYSLQTINSIAFNRPGSATFLAAATLRILICR